MRIFLIVSLLALNITHAQYSQEFGNESQGGSFDQQDGTQGKGKTGTGVERKTLLDSMDISDKTKLDDREKCNTKCEMTFVQCYRIQTDRGKCYSTQQECLGKCGGGHGDEATSEYGSPQPSQSGTLEFP